MMWRRKKQPRDPRLIEKGLINPSFRMLFLIKMIQRDRYFKKNWG